MSATVAVVHVNQDYQKALAEAVALIGGIEGLNCPERDVTIKVGIFDPAQRHHVTIEALRAITTTFDQAPRVYIAESDSYCGKALDRLERFCDVFDQRVRPQSLTDDPQMQVIHTVDEDMPLSHVLFKPHVFISTHVLRTFVRGSILKNLFGCTPSFKKSPYHRKSIFFPLLADIFEAAGGIDLAVLDGTYLHLGASGKKIEVGVLIVGRDAVAVETVGATLAGLKPEKMDVIQEFARRGMGVGTMDQIELVGISAADWAALKKKRRDLERALKAEPRGPGLSGMIDQLVQEGWLDTPRSAQEVTDALQTRGIKNAAKAPLDAALKRRVGKTLERVKGEGGWVYRRKQG